MKPPPFAYHRPETRAAVDRLLAELGDEAKILAGGQSLLPLLNMRLSAPPHVIDINGLQDEPGEPVVDDGIMRFAPLVRHASAERAPHPLIREALTYVGHPAIRSRGTVVGSITHADPAAELPAVVLARDGEVRCRSVDGVRSVAARDFIQGPLETALEPTEWVDEVAIPAPGPGSGYAVEEFARRHGDFAICGVIAVAQPESVRLVHFGIAALPVTTEIAAGAEIRARVREAIADLQITDDLHGTARYRRHLAAELGARAAERARAEAA
jgi:carbon-monoxide dehydrogenase medium subunit